MADECDLVVVGFGAAGAAAAITAADLGASVVVLEALPEDRHTPSSRMSGGIVMSCDDVEAATTYLDHCAGGMTPREVTAAWAGRMAGLIDWFPQVGIDVTMARCGGAEHPDLPGAEAISTWQPGSARRLDASGGGGPALWAAVAAAVARRPVEVRWSTPALRLLREPDGRVVGVATDAGPVRARRGVVLACGGFEGDPWMIRNHLRTDPVRFYGNPRNRGDGVRMAQAAGADLWHMNQMVGRAIGWFPTDEASGEGADPVGLGFILRMDPPGYVIVDIDGQRFADESSQAALRHDFYYELLRYDPARGIYPRNPCFWLFDERRRTAGPLTFTHIGAVAVGLHSWSEDNTAEMARGWISSGASVEEAAAGAGCGDPEAAARSVAAHNEACAAGVDPLGRPAATLVPLDRPPFHCVKLWAGGSNTSGGPRRSPRAEILDPFGVPVPGLYGAGELGQVLGLRYPGDGGNLSDAFCFGQIAAEQAIG